MGPKDCCVGWLQERRGCLPENMLETLGMGFEKEIRGISLLRGRHLPGGRGADCQAEE